MKVSKGAKKTRAKNHPYVGEKVVLAAWAMCQCCGTTVQVGQELCFGCAAGYYLTENKHPSLM